MKTQSKKVPAFGQLLAPAVGIILCGSLNVANAAPLIDQPFSSPIGGLPTGWVSADIASTSAPKIVDLGGTDGTFLDFKRTSGSVAADNPFSPIYFNSIQFADVTSGTVTVQWSKKWNQASVVLRSNSVALQSPLEGYRVTIATIRNDGTTTPNGVNSDVFRLGIGFANNNDNRLDSYALGGWTDLGLANYNLNENYTLQFSIVGSTIDAEVFNSSSVSLGSKSVIDSTYASAGYFGLSSRPFLNTSDLYMKDLVVIPEPTTSAMILVSALGFLVVFRRRVRRGLCR